VPLKGGDVDAAQPLWRRYYRWLVALRPQKAPVRVSPRRQRGGLGSERLTHFYPGAHVVFLRLRCSVCRSEQVVRQGAVLRIFRTVPIGHKPVFVLLPVPRVRCDACGHVRQVHIPFAEPRHRYTHAVERYALDLSRHMTIQDVANHLGVSWDTIKEIQSRSVARRFGQTKAPESEADSHR
jgi:transposase